MASLTSSTRRWRPGSKSPGACPGTGRDREGLQRHLGEHARRLPQGLAAFFLLVPARWLRSPASGSKVIRLNISACASGTAAGDPKRGAPALSVATIERRLSGLAWNFTQRGRPLDRAERHIYKVLAGIRRASTQSHRGRKRRSWRRSTGDDRHARPRPQGLRDRAILLLGCGGGLRRSEIVGLDVMRDDNSDGAGWIEIFDGKGYWSPCAARPAGARSRSAAAPATTPTP